MEAVSSSDTPVTTFHSLWSHIQETVFFINNSSDRLHTERLTFITGYESRELSRSAAQWNSDFPFTLYYVCFTVNVVFLSDRRRKKFVFSFARNFLFLSVRYVSTCSVAAISWHVPCSLVGRYRMLPELHWTNRYSNTTRLTQ
jgi:hypothetical protein